MNTLYAGRLITINSSEGKYRIIPKDDFDRIIVQGRVSRKKARELGIGSRLFNNSLNYHYSKSEIEASRVDKMKNANGIQRIEIWHDNLSRLEHLVPGITELFKNNLRDNPELIEDKLQELNEWYYEIKDFIKTTKKYIRQAVNRKGGRPLKLVANLSEYKVRRILVSLGHKVENQFYLKPYFYDFKVGNYIIEYDGPYHTEQKDKPKTDLAIANGYTIIRVKHFEIKNLEGLRKKLKRRIPC